MLPPARPGDVRWALEPGLRRASPRGGGSRPLLSSPPSHSLPILLPFSSHSLPVSLCFLSLPFCLASSSCRRTANSIPRRRCRRKRREACRAARCAAAAISPAVAIWRRRTVSQRGVGAFAPAAQRQFIRVNDLCGDDLGRQRFSSSAHSPDGSPPGGSRRAGHQLAEGGPARAKRGNATVYL